MDEGLATVLLIIMGIVFGLPLFLGLMIAVFFSIFKQTNESISGLGKALTIPALFAMGYKVYVDYQDRKDQEQEDRRRDE